MKNNGEKTVTLNSFFELDEEKNCIMLNQKYSKNNPCEKDISLTVFCGESETRIGTLCAKWISEEVYIDKKDLVNYLNQMINLTDIAAKISEYFEEEYFDSYILYKDLVVITELDLSPKLTDENAELVMNDLLDQLISVSDDGVVIVDINDICCNRGALIKALYLHHFSRINDLFFY